MDDLINGRTPEEIKCWISSRTMCNTCPKEHETGCEYGERTEDCQMCIDTIAYIERLEAAQPKWISVEDRLPEKEDDYLVRKVHAYNDKDGYSKIDVCIYCKMRDPEWIGCGNLCKVTHWMPLPEPPEEESHG